MAVGRSHELLVFRGQNSAEKIGAYGTKGATLPDIEEIRQIRIADIVVIGRIGGDRRTLDKRGVAGGVLLNYGGRRGRNGRSLYDLRKITDLPDETTCRIAERVDFAEIPDHGQRLTREDLLHRLPASVPEAEIGTPVRLPADAKPQICRHGVGVVSFWEVALNLIAYRGNEVRECCKRRQLARGEKIGVVAHSV